MMYRRSAILWMCAMAMIVLGFSTGVLGQGFVIERMPTPVPVEPHRGQCVLSEITVDARLKDQAASVSVSQTLHNQSNRQLEAEFFFPLPPDAAISGFVFMVDGKEIPGKLMSKDEARSIYENIVRQKKDPALMEYVGCGLFRTSVFPITANGQRTLTFRYTQLCRREGSAVDFIYPLSTQKQNAGHVGKISVNVTIETAQTLKSVYSPSHAIRLVQSSSHRATARYQDENVRGGSDFRLIYTTAEKAVGATVLSYWPSDADQGYFLLLASPGFEKQQGKVEPKTVVFVLDKSGSMSGKKIEQARDALRFVLENLNEGDTFNIIAYDDHIESFKPELQRYGQASRDEAMHFVEGISAGGSTNINEALRTAMEMLKDESRPNYVLFLTDGLPTAGETDEQKIAANCTDANRIQARLIAFGVGYDVNARLIDRLSHGNNGTSEFVKPDEDLEAAVSRFYGKLTAPVLAKIKIDAPSAEVTRAYPRNLPDLFEGSQLVWVGRYRQASQGKTRLTITGYIGGQEVTFTYDGNFVAKGQGIEHAYVESLWATRRVGDLIDQIDLNGRNEELVNELLALSQRYGIMTPYTSFLADEDAVLSNAPRNSSVAYEKAGDMTVVSGASGVGQRQNKWEYQNADQAIPASSPVAAKSLDGNEVVLNTVTRAGNYTFYLKNGQWIDSQLTEKDADNATRIKRFSDEYFALAARQTAEMNSALNMPGDHEVLVQFGSAIYLIEP